MNTSRVCFDFLCRTCMSELEEARSYGGNNKTQEQWQSIYERMSELVEASSYNGNTKQKQQWQPIFDRIEECGALRIVELLSNAVPQIEVRPSDDLPKRICSKCLQQLLSVHRFQQMCVRSEEQMRQRVSRKQTDISIPAAAMESEIETNHLSSFQHSSTEQNLEHTFMQEPFFETTKQVVRPEVSEIDDVDIDQLLEHCRDSQGNLSEFIKNEPIEDDYPEMEYSDGDTIPSIIFVKDEILAVESREKEIETNQQKDHIRYSEDKTYGGPYCLRKFSAKSAMYNHKVIHEDDETRHVCEICGERITKRNFEKHKQSHIDKTKSLINKAKPHINKVELEKRLGHDEDKPYECPYCPRRFKTTSNLAHHKAIHEGVKRETCDICGKSIRKRDLKTHKRIHSDDKVHKCGFCGNRFVQKSHLRSHIRQHTGEKAYKCNYCESAFATNAEYKNHLQLHLGINIYRCEFCPLAFSAAKQLRLHFTTHKDEDSVTRERNMKALEEAEAKLQLNLSKHRKRSRTNNLR